MEWGIEMVWKTQTQREWVDNSRSDFYDGQRLVHSFRGQEFPAKWWGCGNENFTNAKDDIKDKFTMTEDGLQIIGDTNGYANGYIGQFTASMNSNSTSSNSSWNNLYNFHSTGSTANKPRLFSYYPQFYCTWIMRIDNSKDDYSQIGCGFSKNARGDIAGESLAMAHTGMWTDYWQLRQANGGGTQTETNTDIVPDQNFHKIHIGFTNGVPATNDGTMTLEIDNVLGAVKDGSANWHADHQALTAGFQSKSSVSNICKMTISYVEAWSGRTKA